MMRFISGLCVTYLTIAITLIASAKAQDEKNNDEHICIFNAKKQHNEYIQNSLKSLNTDEVIEQLLVNEFKKRREEEYYCEKLIRCSYKDPIPVSKRGNFSLAILDCLDKETLRQCPFLMNSNK